MKVLLVGCGDLGLYKVWCLGFRVQGEFRVSACIDLAFAGINLFSSPASEGGTVISNSKVSPKVPKSLYTQSIPLNRNVLYRNLGCLGRQDFQHESQALNGQGPEQEGVTIINFQISAFCHFLTFMSLAISLCKPWCTRM